MKVYMNHYKDFNMWRKYLRIFGIKAVVITTSQTSFIPRVVRKCKKGEYILFYGIPAFLKENGKVEGECYIYNWYEI